MRALCYKQNWHGTTPVTPEHSSGCSYYCRFGSTLAGLINAWNDATAPNIPRTEHQHKRCRQVARAIDNRMAFEGFMYRIHWGEYSDGTRKML